MNSDCALPPDPIFESGGICCHDAEQTQAAAAALARLLQPGTTLLLCGPLGAGKTTFTQGLARGLGADEHAVSSPTFTVIQEVHGGRIPLIHMDLYRIEHAGELEHLGWHDLWDTESVRVVEWGEKFPDMFPAGTLRIDFEPLELARRIRGGRLL